MEQLEAQIREAEAKLAMTKPNANELANGRKRAIKAASKAEAIIEYAQSKGTKPSGDTISHPIHAALNKTQRRKKTEMSSDQKQ